MYPIWAHIQNVLGMTEDVAESYAECYGLYKQDGKFSRDLLAYKDEENFTELENKKAGRCLSVSLRANKIAESKIAEVYGRLYGDIFSTDKLILPSTKLTIRLWPSNDNFRLMGTNPNIGGGYELKILDASLQLLCYKLSSALHLAQEKALGDSVARYFFYRTVSRQYTLSKNDLSFTASDVWNGVIPSKMYFVMISSDAFSGRLDKNPFYFDHYNCTSFGCIKSGYPLPAGNFLQMDYKNDLVLEAYLNLFKTMGYEGTNTSCNLTYPDFVHGNNIYCFTSDYVDCATAGYLPAISNGQIDLNISFSEPLRESVTLLCLGRHPAAMSLDSVRNAVV